MTQSAGKFDQLVTVQIRSEGRDAHGQALDVWQDVVTDIFARVDPVRGAEYYAAAKEQASATVKVTIRWRPGIVPSMRLVHKGKVFDILDVIDPASSQTELECMCVFGIRDGASGTTPLPAPAPPAPAPAPAPALGMTIGANVGVVDWAESPFNDIVKSARGFGLPNEWSENLDPGQLPRDAEGWPLAASRILITSASDRPGTPVQLGVWRGRWRGPGNLVQAIANAGVVRNVVRVDADTTTFEWEPTGTGPFLSMQFDGAVRDLRLVRPGLDLDNHDLLTPAAAAYWSRFHTLRFLDFMGQNDSEDLGESTWAGRQPHGKWHGRKGWGTMVDFFLAARAVAGSKVRGIWWNVPYRFQEADCLAMGTYLASRLPASVLKFSEKSNELWNSFYNGKWTLYNTRADNVADADYARVAVDAADHWTRLSRLWALDVARMARAMRTAFAGQTTLYPVYAGQFWNTDLTDRGLTFLAAAAQSGEFGAVNSYIGSLSCAPYLTGSLAEMDSAASGDALLSGLRSGFENSLAVMPASLAQWRALQVAHGIARLDAYEWQLHTHGGGNANTKLAANTAAAAGPLLNDMAQAMSNAGFNSAQFLTGSVQLPVSSDVNSFAWPLDRAYTGAPGTIKASTVFALAAAANPA